MRRPHGFFFFSAARALFLLVFFIKLSQTLRLFVSPCDRISQRPHGLTTCPLFLLPFRPLVLQPCIAANELLLPRRALVLTYRLVVLDFSRNTGLSASNLSLNSF